MSFWVPYIFSFCHPSLSVRPNLFLAPPRIPLQKQDSWIITLGKLAILIHGHAIWGVAPRSLPSPAMMHAANGGPVDFSYSITNLGKIYVLGEYRGVLPTRGVVPSSLTTLIVAYLGVGGEGDVLARKMKKN